MIWWLTSDIHVEFIFWYFAKMPHSVHAPLWGRKECMKTPRTFSWLCASTSLCPVFLSLAEEAAIILCELSTGCWFWNGEGFLRTQGGFSGGTPDLSCSHFFFSLFFFG